MTRTIPARAAIALIIPAAIGLVIAAAEPAQPSHGSKGRAHAGAGVPAGPSPILASASTGPARIE